MTDIQKQAQLASRRDWWAKKKALEKFYNSRGLSKDDAKGLLKIGKIMFCSKTLQYVEKDSSKSKNDCDVERMDKNQKDEMYFNCLP